MPFICGIVPLIGVSAFSQTRNRRLENRSRSAVPSFQSGFHSAAAQVNLHDMPVILAFRAGTSAEDLLVASFISQRETLFRFRSENQTVLALLPLDGRVRLVSLMKLPAVNVILDWCFRQAENRPRIIFDRETVALHEIKKVLRKDTPLALRRQTMPAKLCALEPPFYRVMGASANRCNVARCEYVLRVTAHGVRHRDGVFALYTYRPAFRHFASLA